MNKPTRISDLDSISVSIRRDKLNLDKTLNCGQTFMLKYTNDYR